MHHACLGSQRGNIIHIKKLVFSKSVLPTMVLDDYAPYVPSPKFHTFAKALQVPGSASLWNRKHRDSDLYDDLVVKKLA